MALLTFYSAHANPGRSRKIETHRVPLRVAEAVAEGLASIDYPFHLEAEPHEREARL